MKRYAILAFLSFTICAGRAKDAPRYPVSDIPEALRSNSIAVVRDDMMSFTIHTRNTASLHVRYAVTILNENAKHFASRVVYYDKLRKITSLKAQVFDAHGSLVRKLKNNEISDHSAFDGLFDDTRVKVADLTQARYPYTVEFEYEVAYNFLYDIAGSAINPYENVAVQRASYQLSFPEALRPRYKTYNIDQQPQTGSENGRVTLSWSFENLPAQQFEPYSDVLGVIKKISAAPSLFEFEGYEGTMETWDEYGRWIASLNKGRSELPDATKQTVREIAAKHSLRAEKVKALYEFLQNKTRYVSIQLGIGGYQPFEASFVDRTGYGDCKALSNYMLAMLEAVDIKGYYALINAGEGSRKMEQDFPSSQFNHVLVAVPDGTDTLWLECTSQTNPFGYQGKFTGDRKALLITDNGAAIVNTTRYPAEFNVQSTTATVAVDAAGKATASVERIYTGLQYENGGLHFILSGDHEKQKKWIQNHFEIPSFDVQSFTMTNVKDKIPSASVKANLNMDRLATVTGKRMFLTPNLMNRINGVPEKVESRKTDIISSVAFVDVDTIRFRLPEGLYPEFLPKNLRVESRFGNYDASFKIDQGNLVYIRRLKLERGTFPASSYQELVDFYRAVSRADNTKVVLMTKT